MTLGPKGRNVVLDKSFGAPRITKDGDWDWAKNFGGERNDQAGHLYLSDDTVHFLSGSLDSDYFLIENENYTLSDQSSWGYVFGSLNLTTGAFQSHNSLTSNDNSNSHDWPSSVTDSLGNTYVAGSSEGTVSLSGTEYGHEMYLMKVNSEGDLLWNRSLESESNSQGYINNILVDEYDDVVLSGVFHDDLELNDVVSEPKIAAGHLHTCAILTNGSVSCWGENSQGQLGDGTYIKRLTQSTPKIQIQGRT